MHSQPGAELVCWQRSPASQGRLFCFPHAGAGAAAFRSWQAVLPSGLDILASRLPGRESRHDEPMPGTMQEVVASLAAAVRPCMELPFAFLGHCSGSLLAFELTRWLRRSHLPQPRALFVVARGAPQATPRMPPIHHLSTEEFLEAVAAIGDMPEPVRTNRELMELLEPVLRADFRVFERYRLADEAPLDVPISVFGVADDPHISPDDLAAWHEHTTQPFILRLMPGDELSIHPPGRGLLAGIRDDLAFFADGRSAAACSSDAVETIQPAAGDLDGGR